MEHQKTKDFITPSSVVVERSRSVDPLVGDTVDSIRDATPINPRPSVFDFGSKQARNNFEPRMSSSLKTQQTKREVVSAIENDSQYSTVRKVKADQQNTLQISPSTFVGVSANKGHHSSFSEGKPLKLPTQSNPEDDNQAVQSANNSMNAHSVNSQTELNLAEKFNALYEINDIIHVFSLKSLFCMGQQNRFRTLCVRIMVNKWFDRFITVAILINSLLLASKEYEDKYDVTYVSDWNGVLDNIDLVFTFIFLFECIVKVIGMGFVLHKRSYLRDGWNTMDFFIVLISVISFTPGIDPRSLKVFRTARILRPLRSMSQLKSMRQLIQTFISSLPGLFNVCIFQLFIFTIFAIISINFFVGEQYQFCRSVPELIDDGVNPPYWPKSEDAAWQCSSDEMCTGFPNNLGVDSNAKCGDIYRDYGLDPVEFDAVRESEMINFDITNFNSVLNASLTIFQVITLEGWSMLMYNYQDTVSYTTSSIFFVLIVIIGAFTTLNLILASIMHSYLRQDKIRKDEELIEKEKLQAQQTRDIAHKNNTMSLLNNYEVDFEKTQNLRIVTGQVQKNMNIGQFATISGREHLSVIEELELPNMDAPDKQMSLEESGSRKNHRENSFTQHLPALHAQTMTRFNGIMEHQKLEDRVQIEGGLIQMSERSSFIIEKNDKAATSFELLGSIQQNHNESNHLTPVDPADQHHSNNLQDVDPTLALNLRETQNISKNSIESTDPIRTEAEIYAEDRAERNCLYGFFYRLVTSVTFNFLIYLFILGNTITLAMYRFDQSQHQTDILAICDIVFVWVFTVEMLAKLIGLGVKNYIRDKFNIFDAIIVIISLTDFILTMTVEVSESTDGIMSALRALRLLRVVKLARHWKAFQEILITLVNSLIDISNFSILLILMLYIFALLGMELFSYSVVFDIDGNVVFGEDKIKAAFESGQEMVWPRDNFNNILSSMVTCFIVIVAEDWNMTMYQYVRALDTNGSTGRSLALTYFVTLFIIGNTITLALFTALLLKAQDDDIDKLESSLDKKANKNMIRTISKSQIPQDTDGPCGIIKSVCSRQSCSRNCTNFADSFVRIFGGDTAFSKRQKARKQKDPRGSASPISGNAVVPSTPKESPEESKQNQFDNFVESENQQSTLKISKKESTKQMNNFINKDIIDLSETQGYKQLQRPPSLLHYDYDQVKIVNERQQKKKVSRPLFGKSLYILDQDNMLRKFCNVFTNYWLFDAVIIVLILVSTTTLAFEHPLENPESENMQVLEQIDIGMTAAFSLEATLKIITLGFLLNGKKSYLRDTWNQLDFAIVILAILSLNIDANISFVKVLRVVRILRPLRLIQHLEGLKVSILALFRAIPQIMRLQVVVFFIILMISILLTSLLSGKLFRCDLAHTGLTYAQQDRMVKNKWDCISYGGEWVSPEMNFDDTLRGMLTLFIFQSREGWVGLMWDSVDAKGVDQVPVRENNAFFIVLYILLVVVLCLLFVNMFVRIVIQTYNSEKSFLSFNRLLSDQQRSWIQVQIMTYGFKPQKLIKADSHLCFRRICIKVSQSRWFDNLIMGCILLNTLVMALVWFDEPHELSQANEFLNYIFSAIFTLEAIIKLVAQKKMYFKDSWNIFDFTIVIFTLAILLLKALSINVQFGSGATILRALRIGRILRLIKQAQQLQIIFHTLLDSAQSLGSLGLLLIILFFMFAIIGRSFFGLAKIGEPNLELNEHANFRDFTTSFLLLLRCSTGESWHLIMFDLARTYDLTYQCREEEDYDSMMANGGEPFACGSPFTAYIFFVLLHILVTQIFVNLFVAIIIDAFLEQTDHFKLPVKKYDIQDFVDVWAKFDPDATGYILIKDLNRFILNLANTSGGCNLLVMHKTLAKNYNERKRFVTKLGIPTYFQLSKVMFYDTLQQLCYMVNLDKFETEKKEGKLTSKVLHQFGVKKQDEMTQSFLDKSQNQEKELDFEKLLRQMGRLNPKIKLIVQLQNMFKNVHEKYARYADTENNITLTDEERKSMKPEELDIRNLGGQRNKDDLNLLSTKHYFFGHVILLIWLQKIRERRLARAAVLESLPNTAAGIESVPPSVPNTAYTAINKRQQPDDPMSIVQNSLPLDHQKTSEPMSRETMGQKSNSQFVDNKFNRKLPQDVQENRFRNSTPQSSEENKILAEEIKNLDDRLIIHGSPQANGVYITQSSVEEQKEYDHAIVDQEVLERSQNLHLDPSILSNSFSKPDGQERQ